MNNDPTPESAPQMHAEANESIEAMFRKGCDLERQLVALTSKIREWQSMSDAEMRLRCGELSAQDIRNIKAVLESILPTNNETK